MNSSPVNFTNLFAVVACVDDISRDDYLHDDDKSRRLRYEISTLINLAFELEYLSEQVDKRLQFLEERLAD